MDKKSTVKEIKERFDHDVERFSNLETGQQTTLDAKLSLELITQAASRVTPNAQHVLDIGCGAGNYTLALLEKMPHLNCTLVDISQPMLDKALERVSITATEKVHIIQSDIRDLQLENESFDIILAGAVLHHLRDDKDWLQIFKKLSALLKPNGCLFISDIISHENPQINKIIWEYYGQYLEQLGGSAYRKKVLDYIAKEDSPRSIKYQLDLMKKVGFNSTEILHKNLCFGAFCGIK